MENSDEHLNVDGNSKKQRAEQVEDRQQKLAEARKLIQKYIPDGRSLIDELIQERRDEEL